MIEQLIKNYQLKPDCFYPYKSTENNSVIISEGNNEGYYIDVIRNGVGYTFRTHNYDEALKIMSVMLKVINTKR